ncbi:c-type cytochrome [Solimonas soli]|uniref:c-type cytochrome n=1 Tax=Solimonas soli TaxID=413479 RepID=UPI0004AC7F7D|nr:c-type cytochrome [Solimonas soli]
MRHESCGERQRLVGGCVVVTALAIGLLLASCQRKESTAEKAVDTPIKVVEPPPSPTDVPEEQLRLAGRGVATSGVGTAGIPPCTSCHGQQGEGNAAGGYPRIAGHPRAYIELQLDAFADATRVNPIMQPIAKNLTREQRHAVAAYYATLEPSQTPAPPKVSAGDARRAARLSAVGDESRQLQACANCHGPEGRGAAPRYPPLAGQQAGYLVNALKEWRSGARHTDPSGQMPSIARALDDDDIRALAAYFAAQPAPPAAGKRSRQPPGAPTSGSGPDAAAPPAQGVGSEQGLPLTGATPGRRDSAPKQGADRRDQP